MLLHTVIFAMSIVTGSPVAQSSEPAQKPDSQVTPRGPERRRDRDGNRNRDGNRGGNDRRGRRFWDQDQENATPEQRQAQRVEFWVDRTSRTYDLDDKQKETVRAEILAIDSERRAVMGPLAEEYDKRRTAFFQYMRKAREQAGDDEDRGRFWRQMRDDPKAKELRDSMQEIEQQYPFDWQASVTRIESLLPPEQVKKSHERMEQRRNRRDDRNRDRQQGRDGQPGGDAKAPDSSANGQANPPSPAPSTPLNPWEKYVRDFIKNHELSSSQETAALGILKDIQARAVPIGRTVAQRKTEIEQITDAAEKTKRLKDVDKPLDDLFAEMKTRLDGLLTATQRQKKAI